MSCPKEHVFQVVSHPGCKSERVRLNVCTGGCEAFVVDSQQFMKCCETIPEEVAEVDIPLKCSDGSYKMVKIDDITRCSKPTFRREELQ